MSSKAVAVSNKRNPRPLLFEGDGAVDGPWGLGGPRCPDQEFRSPKPGLSPRAKIISRWELRKPMGRGKPRYRLRHSPRSLFAGGGKGMRNRERPLYRSYKSNESDFFDLVGKSICTLVSLAHQKVAIYTRPDEEPPFTPLART